MSLIFIDILVFALIAGFLFFRLKSVLGTRHGEEKKRGPYAFEQSPIQDEQDDNVITVNQFEEKPLSLKETLTRMSFVDTSFHPKDFTRGAKHAFELIVESFAKGDVKTLEPLLTPELMDSFEQVIQERKKKGHVAHTDILHIKTCDIIEASINKDNALITVSFEADETRFIKDKDGNLISGDPDHVHQIKDVWTFSKNLRSRDPNWILVETRTDSKEVETDDKA